MTSLVSPKSTLGHLHFPIFSNQNSNTWKSRGLQDFILALQLVPILIGQQACPHSLLVTFSTILVPYVFQVGVFLNVQTLRLYFARGSDLANLGILLQMYIFLKGSQMTLEIPKFGNQPKPCNSKFGVCTHIKRLTWEFVRNAKSQAPPQTCWISMHFTKMSRRVLSTLKFERHWATVLHKFFELGQQCPGENFIAKQKRNKSWGKD